MADFMQWHQNKCSSIQMHAKMIRFQYNLHKVTIKYAEECGVRRQNIRRYKGDEHFCKEVKVLGVFLQIDSPI